MIIQKWRKNILLNVWTHTVVTIIIMSFRHSIYNINSLIIISTTQMGSLNIGKYFCGVSINIRYIL